MSRTILITTAGGAKVRTVHSKVYFVVNERLSHSRYNSKTREFVRLDPPVLTARVFKRTDSPMAALAELRRNPTGSAVFMTKVVEGKVEVRALTRGEIEARARHEKLAKKRQVVRRNVWA